MWNGIKIKSARGSSLDPATAAAIEAIANNLDAGDVPPAAQRAAAR
ncbi:hypothetical protein, partial [Calditerricola satsumensis]